VRTNGGNEKSFTSKPGEGTKQPILVNCFLNEESKQISQPEARDPLGLYEIVTCQGEEPSGAQQGNGVKNAPVTTLNVLTTNRKGP